MSADKQLKISVKSELREGASLMKFLNELASTGNRVAKSLQSINLGGAGVGAQKGALAKAVLEQKSLFKDLGKAGEDLARIMTNQVAKSTVDLDKKLEDTNKRLKAALDLHKQFSAELSRTKGGTQGRRVFESLVNDAQSDIEKLLGDKNAMQGAKGGLSGGKGSIWTKDLAPGMSQIPGLGGLARFAGPAAIAGVAINGVIGAVTSAAERGNQYAANQAATGDAVGQALIPTAMGDPTMAWAMQRMLSDPAKRKELVEYLENKRTGAQWGGTVKGITGMLKNPAMGGHTILQALSETGSANIEVKRAIAEKLNMELAGAPLETEQLRQAVSLAPQHLAAGRRMGSMSDVTWAANQGKWSGMDEGQVEGVAISIVDRAGRSASRRLRDVALRAVIGGMQDAAGVAGATATDSMVLPRLAGTGFDKGNLSVLGQAVAAGMSPLSMNSQGSERLSMLSWGIPTSGDSAVQRRMMEQNIAGDQSLGALFGGHDPYQKSVNLVNAIKRMGAGSSIYGQNALAGSLKDTNVLAGIMRGKVPQYLQDLGITKEAAQGFVGDTLNSQLNRVIQDKGTAATPAGQAASQALGSGDIRKYIQSHKGDLHSLASALAFSNESMFPGGAPQAEAMLRDIGGMGSMVKPGGWGDGGMLGKDKDGKAIPSQDLSLLQTQLSQVADNFNKIRAATEGIGNQSVPVIQTLQQFQKFLELLGGMSSTGEGSLGAYGRRLGLNMKPTNPQAKPDNEIPDISQIGQ